MKDRCDGWIERCNELRAENETLRSRVAQLEAALHGIMRMTTCDCPPDYTRNGRHAPVGAGYCNVEIHEEARDALATPPVQPHHCDRYVTPSCQTCWPDGGMREFPEDDAEEAGP